MSDFNLKVQNFLNFLNQLKETLTTEIVQPNGQKTKGPKPGYEALYEHFGKIESLLYQNKNNTMDAITPERYSEYRKANSELKLLLSDYMLKNPMAKEGEEEIRGYITEFSSYFNNPEENPIDSVLEGIRINHNTVEKIRTGSFENDIKQSFKTIGLYGKRPSTEELMYPETFINDPDKTLSYMLWISTNYYKFRRLYPQEKATMYVKAFDTITELIKKSPSDFQAKYTERLTALDQACKDAALKVLENSRNNAPEGRDPEEYAREMLYKSDEGIALQSIDSMRNVLTLADVGVFTISLTRPKANKTDYALYERKSDEVGNIMIDLRAYLGKKKIIPESNRFANSYEIGRFEKELAGAGIMTSPEYEALTEDFRTLLEDKDPVSESFEFMRQSLKAFMNHDTADTKSERYEYVLENALKAAQDYAKGHRGYRFSDRGKRRQNACSSIIEKLTAIKEKHLEEKNRKVNDFEYASEPGTAEDTIIRKIAADAVKRGIPKEQYVSEMMAKELEIKTDIIPELAVSEEKQASRKQLSRKAKEAFLKTRYDIYNLDKAVLKGEEFGEYNGDVNSLLEDRDLKFLLFDLGDDPATVRKNIDMAKSYMGQTVKVYGDKKEAAVQQNKADLVSRRIEELAAFDFDKYMSLSDEEFVEKYEEISKVVLRTSLMRDIIKRCGKDFPGIKQETLDKADIIVNKYANFALACEQRISKISNPYYALVDTDLISRSDADIIGQLPDGLSSEDPALDRFNLAVQNQYNADAMIFADYINARTAKKLAGEKNFTDVSYYGADGKPLADSELKNYLRSNEAVFAVSKTMPKKAEVFSFDEKTGLPHQLSAEEALKYKDIAAELLEKQTEKYITEGYKKIAASAQKFCRENATPSSFESQISSYIKDIMYFNVKQVYAEYNISKADSFESAVEDIHAGKSFEEIRDNEIFKDKGNLARDLYDAVQLDIKYREKAERAAAEMMDGVTLKGYTKGELDAFEKTITEENLQKRSPEEMKMLQEKAAENFDVLKKMILSRKLRPSTHNRSFSIAMYKPGLSKEEQREIAVKSYSAEGRKEIITGIIEDMLDVDFEKMAGLSGQEYVDNYEYNEYIRNMCFDPTYITHNSGLISDILSPMEQKEFYDFIQELSVPMCSNHADSLVTMHHAYTYVNPAGLNDDALVRLMNHDHVFGNVWADIIASKSIERKPEILNKYDSIIERKWISALLSKPGLTEDEKNRINEAYKNPDKAAGRKELYSYALDEIRNAAKLEGFENDPETASYVRAMGLAGKLVLKSMSRDNAAPSKEISDEISLAAGKMSKVKADMSKAIARGRSLNPEFAKEEKQYEEEVRLAQEKKKEESEKAARNGYKSKLNDAVKGFLRSVNSGEIDKAADFGSRFIFLATIADPEKDDVRKLEAASNPVVLREETEKIKAEFKPFIERIPVNLLKETAKKEGFGTELISSFRKHIQQVNEEKQKNLSGDEKQKNLNVNDKKKDAPEVNQPQLKQ